MRGRQIDQSGGARREGRPNNSSTKKMLRDCKRRPPAVGECASVPEKLRSDHTETSKQDSIRQRATILERVQCRTSEQESVQYEKKATILQRVCTTPSRSDNTGPEANNQVETTFTTKRFEKQPTTNHEKKRYTKARACFRPFFPEQHQPSPCELSPHETVADHTCDVDMRAP